ncbi:carbohydrate ABC transporter permease [Bacillus sp. SD088]|uniref:carbohydrate ABC transporter permease n=1 Tax=Bacillus sp. SD088 TaxID=2782012 RepID=UPI001F609CA0|nr:sugar ABC transporter permease [Bacillus sp. SD088]
MPMDSATAKTNGVSIVKERSNHQLPMGKWRKTWLEMKRNKISYFLLAPFLIFFTTFTIVPIFTSIGLSFSYYNIVESPNFVGLSNYRLLFVDDDIFLKAIGVTFTLAFVTGPVGYIMSFFLAWLISQVKQKFRFFYTLCFYTPSVTSAVAISVVWLYFFAGDRKGLLNHTLIKLGILNEPYLFLQNVESIIPVIIFVSLWMSMGIGFLAFLAGLQNVPRELYEAGKMDGVKYRWQELWYITLPSVKPQLLFGAVMQVVSSLQIFDVSTQLVGFPSPLYAGHTILSHLHDYAFIRFEMGYASAIAVVLFLIMLGLNRLIFRTLGGED